MIRALSIISLALFVASGAAADVGRVEYVTAAAAFLDQGSEDGLAAGQRLELLRKKRKVGSCEVTSLSAHHAVCTSDRAELGDRFTFTAPPAQGTKGGAKGGAGGAKGGRAQALPDERSVAAQREIVVATPIQKVRVARVREAAGPKWGARGELIVRHQAYATMNAPDAVFQRPALEAGVRANIGVLAGLQAGGALRLVGDALAPASARFRPDEAIELTVWEAGVFLDEPRAPLVAALGRFRPRRAPGAPLVDGALVGGRALDGTLEIGGYAGALPDLVTLAPRLDQFGAGVYLAVDAPLAADVVLLPRARIGLVSTSDFLQSRAEIEAQAQLCFSDFVVVGGGARVGVDGRTFQPSLDAAHASVDNRPVEGVLLRAGYRFVSGDASDIDAAIGGGVVPPVVGAQHGDVAARWSATPWLAVGVVSGLAAVASPLSGDGDVALRGWVGPELTLPGALLGGDLGLLYLEELGAFSGRSTYLQSTHFLGDARLIARVSYFETAAEGAEVDALREAGALVGIDAPLTSWLSVQARAQSVWSLPPLDGHLRATPIGLVAQAGLGSAF